MYFILGEHLRAIVLIILIFGQLTARANELVKVRLFQSLRQINISGFGLAFQGQGALEIQEALPRLQRARVKKIAKGWEIKYHGAKKPITLTGKKVRIVGEVVKINGKAVPDATLLVAKKGLLHDVVAELTLESYLQGVLPSEMPGGWPLEALKAQAVASRTYVLKIIAERRHKNFHVESTVEDQVYEHINISGAKKSIRNKVKKAIMSTKGRILKRNGEMITTYYHADCGGQTEEPFRVWKNHELNGSVKDVACPLSPNGTWQIEFSKNWLSERLRSFFQFEKTQVFERLFVASRTPSGRVEQLEAHFHGEVPQTMSAQNLRRLMGFKKIKSTNFHLQWRPKDVLVYGRGHGHGVGLCQWGARFLALQGLKFNDILDHYYPNSLLATAD